MPKKNERVTIVKTNREWKIIEKRISELGSKDYNRYLHKKIASLIEDYKKCPECINNFLLGKKSIRQKTLSFDFYKILSEISENTGVPISTIVDKVIITPLLIEK